jgi:hypothetical protein
MRCYAVRPYSVRPTLFYAMSYSAIVYKVMIASPSDVSSERNIVRELLSEWNVVHADSKKAVLLPIGWETHSVPEMGGRPQEFINKQVLKDCDLLVGVFWTRIGTATSEYASGTVEEIEEHIKAGKPTMLYFSSAPVVPESIDAEQFRALGEFKKTCQPRGLYESYTDLNDFRSKLYRHLQIKLLRGSYFQQGVEDSGADAPQEVRQIPQLSKEAAFLLKEAAADADGTILNLAFIGGRSIQVGVKNLIEDGNARSRALWTGALSELEVLGFVEAASPKREVFRVTREGYDAVELLA